MVFGFSFPIPNVISGFSRGQISIMLIKDHFIPEYNTACEGSGFAPLWDHRVYHRGRPRRVE